MPPAAPVPSSWLIRGRSCRHTWPQSGAILGRRLQRQLRPPLVIPAWTTPGCTGCRFEAGQFLQIADKKFAICGNCGAVMAGRTEEGGNPQVVAASVTALADDLLAEVRRRLAPAETSTRPSMRPTDRRRAVRCHRCPTRMEARARRPSRWAPMHRARQQIELLGPLGTRYSGGKAFVS